MPEASALEQQSGTVQNFEKHADQLSCWLEAKSQICTNPSWYVTRNPGMVTKTVKAGLLVVVLHMGTTPYRSTEGTIRRGQLVDMGFFLACKWADAHQADMAIGTACQDIRHWLLTCTQPWYGIKDAIPEASLTEREVIRATKTGQAMGEVRLNYVSWDTKVIRT